MNVFYFSWFLSFIAELPYAQLVVWRKCLQQKYSRQRNLWQKCLWWKYHACALYQAHKTLHHLLPLFFLSTVFEATALHHNYGLNWWKLICCLYKSLIWNGNSSLWSNEGHRLLYLTDLCFFRIVTLFLLLQDGQPTRLFSSILLPSKKHPGRYILASIHILLGGT